MSFAISSTDARTTLLRDKVAEFCQLFVSGSSSNELLSKCFGSNPRIHEHGPSWATKRLPFLARTWTGRRLVHPKFSISPETGDDQSCDEYFDLLGAALSFHPMENSIPSADEFIVSPGKNLESGKVIVEAKSGLKSVQTGISWEEEFIFMFSEFDGEGGIGRLDIWSDALNAWMAVAGEVFSET